MERQAAGGSVDPGLLAAARRQLSALAAVLAANTAAAPPPAGQPSASRSSPLRRESSARRESAVVRRLCAATRSLRGAVTRTRGLVQLAPLNYAALRRDLRALTAAVGAGDSAEADQDAATRCCLLLQVQTGAQASRAPSILIARAALRRFCHHAQALRWRLTRSRPGRSRRAVLHAMSSGDALGCMEARAEAEGSLLYSLASSPSPSVREYAMRLTNCMASEWQGRTYLLQDVALIPVRAACTGSRPLRCCSRGAVAPARSPSVSRWWRRSLPSPPTLQRGSTRWARCRSFRCGGGRRPA